MEKRYNLLIADDHKLFRQSLKKSLSRIRFINKIGEAANGKQVLEQIKQFSWDIVLLDMQMTPMDGAETLKRLAEFSDIPPVLVVSYEPSFIDDARDLGAQGFLDKNCDHEELREAIQRVVKGGTYFKEPSVQELSNAITAQDIKVLRLICQEKTNKEIADKMEITMPSLEYLLKKLREKTGCANNVGLSLYAVKRGHYSPQKNNF